MLPALLKDRSGTVAIMSAFLISLGCGVAALAIDAASIALAARRLQGAADLAATAAAQNLDTAQTSAERTAAANVTDAPVATTIALGVYTADDAIAAAHRFVADAANPNAVKVTLKSSTPLYFGAVILGRDRFEITRSAIGARRGPQAMFSIGSRLAGLDGGIGNQILFALTGSSVSLSAMDYRALADAKVNLLGFSDALGTELHLTAGDYQSVLNGSVNLGKALEAVQAQTGVHAAPALAKLISATTGKTLPLTRLIGVDAGDAINLKDRLDVEVSALDLVMAMLEVSGGDRQVALSFGATPGLAALSGWLAIGERPNQSPWMTLSPSGGGVIRTAQARLFLRARTTQKVSGLAQVDLPILVELAASEARLEEVDCRPERAVTLGVRPGLAKVTLGEIDTAKLSDFKRELTTQPATLLSVAGLASVTGSAKVEVADTGYSPVKFDAADIDQQRVKTVSTRQITQSAFSSLLGDLELKVKALGLGLDLGGLAAAIGALTAPLGPVLDAAVNPVLDAVGLGLGEADVQTHAVKCDIGRARMVG